MATDKGKGRAAVPAAAAASTARPTHVPGGKVISYFSDTDGQFGNPSIGYDVDRFNAAVQKVVVPESKKQREEDAQWQKERERRTQGKVEVNGVKEHDQGVEPAEAVEIKKADVELIAAQLEVSSKDAEDALKRAGGNVVKALVQLTAPTIPQPQAVAT